MYIIPNVKETLGQRELFIHFWGEFWKNCLFYD